jgi:imidazolonepropionase-like amidohydrolase
VTRLGAKAIGLDNFVGSIKKGKFADLTFFSPDFNPLDNIANVEKIMMVMKNGFLYNCTTMDQIFPENVKNPPMPPLNRPKVQ